MNLCFKYISILPSAVDFEKYHFLNSILLIPLFSIWFNEENAFYSTIHFDFQYGTTKQTKIIRIHFLLWEYKEWISWNSHNGHWMDSKNIINNSYLLQPLLFFFLRYTIITFYLYIYWISYVYLTLTTTTATELLRNVEEIIVLRRKLCCYDREFK